MQTEKGGQELNLPFVRAEGMNPVIPMCAYCGKERDEIVFLGPNFKDASGKPATPPLHMLVDLEPCKACRRKVEHEGYLAYVADCGHAGLVKRAALPPSMQQAIGDRPCIRMDRCFTCVSKK